MYLKGCWAKCLADEIRFPTHFLCTDQDTGGARKVSTGFLNGNVAADDDHNPAVIDPQFPEADAEDDRAGTACQVVEMSPVPEDEESVIGNLQDPSSSLALPSGPPTSASSSAAAAVAASLGTLRNTTGVPWYGNRKCARLPFQLMRMS